jgi:pimeloyl-ACP methyl ester carboxylesterase
VAEAGASLSAVVGEDDGRPIHMAYLEAGDPEAALHVLLLHGLFDHKSTWRGLAAQLAGAGYHVVAPDLIGFGYSSKPGFASRPPSQRYSVDAQVGFLRAFLQRLGLDDLVLLGNSIGGGIALRSLCTPWPEPPRVRGLVLEDAAGYAQTLPIHLRLLAEWPGRLLLIPVLRSALLKTGLDRALTRSVFRNVFYDRSRIPDDLVDQAVALLREPNILYSYRTAARNLIPDDMATFPERYRDIEAPTLIMWGREDRLVPPLFGLRFESEIPGARLHVFDECGHAPHLELPVETGAVVRDWLRRNVEGA